MIPYLYQEFQSSAQGYRQIYIGNITHCRKCEVREVRNGSYTLYLETTINDECADLITSQKVIKIKPNPFDDPQFFEIQKTSRTYDGIIKVEAKHIKSLCFSICTTGQPTVPDDPYSFTGTPTQVWNHIASEEISGSVPFSFSSNISNSATFYLGLTTANSLGNILGGEEGSFLDTFGGEYKWDNFSISLLSSRGRNTNYQIRYGKNVSDATQTETCESTYSHVLPWGWATTNSGNKVNITADLVPIPNSQSVYQKVYILDCSEALGPYVYGPQPHTSLAELRAYMQQYALAYAKSNNLGSINVGITVTLRAELDDMSNIGLCDTVKVVLDNFGTEATAKIVDVTYDALLERWNKIVIGSPNITVADLILNKRRYINDNR